MTKQSVSKFRMMFFLIGFLLSIPMGVAQTGPGVGDLPVVVTLRGVGLGPADFENRGQVTVLEGELGFEIPLNPTTGTLGRLSFQSDLVEVDTQGAVGPLTDTELDSLLTTTVGYFLAVPGSGPWSTFFRGGLIASGESGAAADDSLLYNGMGGADFAVSRRLSIQMGVLATTRLEEDPLVLPLVGFRWRPAPGWFVGTEGAGLKISGPIQRDLQFMIHAGWLTRAWRLDDDEPEPDGILATETIRLEAGLRWKYGAAWQFEAGLGWEPSRTYRLLDAEGRSAGIQTTEGAPLASLSATFRF
jgi:hypothetical protein